MSAGAPPFSPPARPRTPDVSHPPTSLHPLVVICCVAFRSAPKPAVVSTSAHEKPLSPSTV